MGSNWFDLRRFTIKGNKREGGEATPATRKRRSRSNRTDMLVHLVLLLVGGTSILVLFLVFAFLFWNAAYSFEQIGIIHFLTGAMWNPTSSIEAAFGMLPLMAGTFLVTIVSALIAVPIGIGATIYLAEIAHPKIRTVLKPTIEILAGIPSVVFGLFALLILSGWIKDIFDLTVGWNALNGGIILAVMMIPIMVSLSEDAISSVPKDLREAAFALGATRWETMKGVILPAALSGIVAAIILSMGRAIGETMAVLMATGNSPILTLDVFSSVQTMTATIAIEMGEVVQGSVHYSALFAVGVILFVITLATNSVAEFVMLKYREAYR